MRSFKSGTTRNIISYFAILAVVFCAIIAAPMHSRARAGGNTIDVTNNTSRTMTHIYLAAPERDNWSADQLNDAILSPGQSFTLTNVDCYDSGIKVIAEDADGCFVTTTMACSANGAWAITNDAIVDCGR